MSYCLDLSGFVFLSSAQLLQYKQAWYTFNRVQLYNSNVSTLRYGGNLTQNYYQYVTNDEKKMFSLGQTLHTQSYPTYNWTNVQQN